MALDEAEEPGQEVPRGFVEGGVIECPLHQACFEIATGRCLSGPATVDLHTYAVRVDGGEVFVRTPEPNPELT